MKKIFIMLLIVLVTSGLMINNSYAIYGIDETEIYEKTTCDELLTYNDVPIVTTFAVYNLNGTEYPAYCLEVDLPGIGEEGSYNVDTNELLDDEGIWKVIINGYPYKTLEQLGAGSEEEAYTATKQAVYCAIYDRTADDYGYVDTEEGERTYNVLKQILNSANSSNEKLNINNYINVVPDEEWVIDEENGLLYRTYHLDSNINIGKYEIEMTSENKSNVQICNMQNEVQTEFDVNSNFKLITNLVDTHDEEIRINVKAFLKTKPVIFGLSQIPYTQDYALTGRFYDEVEAEYIDTIEKWAPTPTPTPTQAPTPTPTPTQAPTPTPTQAPTPTPTPIPTPTPTPMPTPTQAPTPTPTPEQKILPVTGM